MLDELRIKEKDLAKCSANLATAHVRIEELQHEIELARGALDTLRNEYNRLAEMDQKQFD